MTSVQRPPPGTPLDEDLNARWIAWQAKGHVADVIFWRRTRVLAGLVAISVGAIVVLWLLRG